VKKSLWVSWKVYKEYSNIQRKLFPRAFAISASTRYWESTTLLCGLSFPALIS